MNYALHGVTLKYSNLASDLHIAGECGFDSYIIPVDKLDRYLGAGCELADLQDLFRRFQVIPVCIDGVELVETGEETEKDEFLRRTETLCHIAEHLGVTELQLVTSGRLVDQPWKEVLDRTAACVAQLCSIGEAHGVRMSLEATAWSAVHALWQSLAVIDAAGCANVGLILDLWQLWAGGETHPSEINHLALKQIDGVHFDDGKKPLVPGEDLRNPELRSWLPGTGQVPLKDWVSAIKATGYNGWWSAELNSPRHWEWDLMELANTCHTALVNSIG